MESISFILPPLESSKLSVKHEGKVFVERKQKAEAEDVCVCDFMKDGFKVHV